MNLQSCSSNILDKVAPCIELEDILPPPWNTFGLDEEIQQIGCSRAKASLQADIQEYW